MTEGEDGGMTDGREGTEGVLGFDGCAEDWIPAGDAGMTEG